MDQLTYTHHAEFVRMPEREITKADVERIVFGPDARPPYVGKGGATREFYALVYGLKFTSSQTPKSAE